MNSGKRLLTLILVTLGLAVLILDGTTAMEGARSGLEVCLQTVLPSLFPFLFLSSILTEALSTVNHKRHSVISQLYGIPKGTEGILVTGLLGGYPVGAKCVREAVAQSQLSSVEAERMLVFCNATGPAFLFGITSNIFEQQWIPWCLWGIHLLSGLYIARLSKSTTQSVVLEISTVHRSVPQQLRQALRVMGEICGWVVLMRTVITVAQRLFLWRLPESLVLLVTGALEISNGCIALAEVRNIGLRFVLCSIFLNFGGLCVAMQTHSVSAGIKQRRYLHGKCLQALAGFTMAYTVQRLAFPPAEQLRLPLIFHFVLVIVAILSIHSRLCTKKSYGIFEDVGV